MRFDAHDIRDGSRWMDARRSRRVPIGTRRFAALLLFGAVLVSCGGPAEGPRQAILILLDAARPDRFSALGYPRPTTPALDALAERGVLFEGHYAHATHTRDSIPQLLYSRYFTPPMFPDSDRVPLASPAQLFLRLDDEAVSLPRALAADGLLTAAISAHSWTRRDTPFAAEFDELHDLTEILDYPKRYGAPRAEQVVDYALDWLETHLDRDFFLYLHLLDTHFPHFLDEDARLLLGPDGLAGADLERFEAWGRPRDTDRPLEGAERRYLDALYDGSLRYADRHLGRLFDFLAERGALDRMRIAVTADHGEHLLEYGGRFAHGGRWYDAVARVPLILFHPPTLEPGRVGALTETVDVLPTLLGLLGTPLPSGRVADGIDLAALARGEIPPRREVVAPLGVRAGDDKLVFPLAAQETLLPLLRGDGSGGGVPGAQLFDLGADPLETRDLAAEHPELVADLLARYRRRLAGPYRRFQSARRETAPREAFAIAARSFQLEPGDAEDGPWRLSRHWSGYYLWGDPGAPAVELSFPLPDGSYRVTAAIRGAAKATLPGGEPRAVEGAPVREEPDLRRQIATDVVDCGEVQVTGSRFRLWLQPVDGQPLLVRHLGFQPLTEEPPAEDAEQREREERLRTLGYID